VDDDQRAHLASYVNASRVCTYLRGGVEQYHGAIVQTYKVRVKYSSLCVGTAHCVVVQLTVWWNSSFWGVTAQCGVVQLTS
jgi:hypothetical protein